MYSPFTVCREILRIGKDNGMTDISPMKLIKLAYICHGFHLAYFDKPLFDDKVEAWKYGPVIRSIYNEVKHRRGEPVLYEQFDYIETPIAGDSLDIIKAVMKSYGKHTPIELSAITHKADTPWDITVSKGRSDGYIIPNALIKEYYKGIMSKYE